MNRSLTDPIRVAIFSLGFAWVIGSAGCAGEVRSVPSEALLVGGASAVLPTRDCHGLFLVDALINGRGPYTLVIDTGSAATVVSPDVARELSADARTAMFVSTQGAGGDEAPVRSIVSVKAMRIGSFEVRGFDAAAMDLGAIGAAMGTRIDGIVGFPAFAHVLLTLDYPRRRVLVEHGALPPPDGREVLSCTTTSMARVEIAVGDDRQTALLDSGFDGALNLAGFSYAPIASPVAHVQAGAVIGGKAGDRVGRLGVDVRFGRVVLSRPVVGESGTESLIGAAALRDFVVTFDQQHQRVRLRTDGSGTVSFPPVRSSGLSIEARDGTWIVVSVSPGGPADSAGVRAGDEVVACEGRPMSVSRCDAPWAGLPDDSRVTLGLRIDGAERRVTIDRPIVVP